MAVALHRRWFYLVPLGAVGTVVMPIGWAGKFFERDPSSQAGVAVVVCLGFVALFLGATIFARRREQSSPALTGSAILLAAVGYGFGGYFLGDPAVGLRIGFVFSFVLLANVCVMVLLRWSASVHVFTPELAVAAMAAGLWFSVSFLLAFLVARRFGRSAGAITWSAVALPAVAFLVALGFINYPWLAARPGWRFTFVLLADACLLVIAWCEEESPRLANASGLAVFFLLAIWTGGRLTAPLLPWALAFYLLHAILHTAFPLLGLATGPPRRPRGGASSSRRWRGCSCSSRSVTLPGFRCCSGRACCWSISSRSGSRSSRRRSRRSVPCWC